MVPANEVSPKAIWPSQVATIWKTLPSPLPDGSLPQRVHFKLVDDEEIAVWEQSGSD